MTDTNVESKIQNKHKSEVALNALEQLLTSAGFEAGDLQIALEAINQAKEEKNLKKKDDNGYEYYLEKTLVYDDKDAFIYRRATSKTGRWYFRIYDAKQQKPIIQSLKTTDKVQALTNARMRYIDIKGKIDRGERLTSITTMELVDKWEDKLKSQITDIPHLGLTPDSFKQKRFFLKNWRDYLIHLKIHNQKVDKVKPEELRDFGTWFQQKPKETALHTGKRRSAELINNNISEVIRMYHQMGVRDKYISEVHVPNIDRLKQEKDEGYKRDIMTEEEYDNFWRYLQFTYLTKKKNPLVSEQELEIRKIFKEYIFILSGAGFRPKELCGIKLSEITDNPKWDSDRRETHVLMKVRKENSKTGRSRVCVAPVKKRIKRILDSYKKIGIVHQPDDYLFISHRWVVNGVREPYSRQTMYTRLKSVLDKSGMKKDFEKKGKKISLYSFRHQYACWRLRYGDVPIHLLAKQMGTSVEKIYQTYGHIEVEQQAEVITKAQKHIKNTGLTLEKPEIVDEELISHSQMHRVNFTEAMMQKLTKKQKEQIKN